MKKINSVKKRLFISNTLIVLLTLSLFFIINFIFLKIYFHSIEQQLYLGHLQTLTNGQIEDLIENIFLANNHFYIYFFIDGILCIWILLMVSQFFTKKLVHHFMEPLEILLQATKRIKRNDLSTPIYYQGDLEFETICEAFNDMQLHLLQSQERNRHYEKTRKDMIAGISHDLKTPLTAIKGSIKTLLDGVVTSPQKQKQFLQIAYQRSDEMSILLNQLLELSKLDQVPLKLEKISLAEFIQHYIQQQSSVFNISFMNSVDNSIMLSLDSLQMKRILDNLVENSKKYAHVDPLKIEITISPLNDFIDLCFKDNGQGVNKENLPHLFNEFYREDPARNSPGQGLGLYIVKNLVEEMHGHIEAKNENGLAIHMYFPIKGAENHGK